jgi:hypothetical protein
LGTILHALRSAVGLLLWPFDLLPDWLGLTLVSVLCGAGMLWVVGKTTPQARLERARDRLAAGVYEVRLFLDSPRRILAAQGSIAVSSVVYIGLVVPALVVVLLPLGLFFLQLEARHGLAPLPVNEPLVVELSLANPADGREVSATGSDGVLITAPLVVDEVGGRVFVRAEIQRPGSHAIRFSLQGVGVDKRLDAAYDRHGLSPTRSSGADLLFALTTEPPLDPAQGITNIAVRHPPRERRWLATAMPWWVYWLAVATVAALALRRRMGVVL